MKILEELWYGNIAPTDYNANAYTEYKLKLLAVYISGFLQKLTATLKK